MGSALRSSLVCSESFLPKLANLQCDDCVDIRGYYCPTDILGKEREDQSVGDTVEHYVGYLLQNKSDGPRYHSDRIRSSCNSQSLVRSIVDIAEDGNRI